MKPRQWPVSRPQKYIHTHFNKEKIKIGAAIQREEQRKRAKDVLQLRGDIKEDLTQKEVEENTCKEQLKKEQAERYARRARERQEEETGKVEDIMGSGTQVKGGSKAKEPKKPCRSKGKAEVVQEQINEEEEEYEERAEGSLRKRKIGCINP